MDSIPNLVFIGLFLNTLKVLPPTIGTKTVKLCPKFCKCVPNSVKMQNLGHFILSERYFCCQESVHHNYFENDS
ncbi:hypothetical protein B0A58_00560 [Flavobacterium branchiophilum NBRC 15030 = ATCC 35035]|nr:hypothetical protein B0A58_00560 [Flavobacterium branchiophilum NBRC 15030 = ATCC 35035]